ncbi:MAG: amidase [Planctomycetota bacterium]|nr:amidase [Planctomycetota bacterium]
MHSPSPSLPPWSRRAFLAGMGAGALPLRPGQAPGDPEDMAAAARLVGLEFSEDQLDQAKGNLARRRRDYQALREQEVPFELPPCTRFDPVPTGHPAPPTGPGYTWRAPEALPAPTDDLQLAFANLSELAVWLRRGDVTSRQLTELSLQRLEKYDPQLHCVITLLRDEAIATAENRDRELAEGRVRGPLHGIPYGAKDLFAWPSAPTTFGAEPFRNHQWNLRATVLDRLQAQGAVLVAKLSLGALAMGDLWFGERTRNPWNPDQGSSGSSAGSASATAAGLVPFSLGSETLGSIVSPCTRCGVAGLRPTFGAVSRHGAMPLSWTMDKVGIIARSAIDQAMVFEAIRGADGRDPSARDAGFPFDPTKGLRGLRIAVLESQRGLRRPEDRAFLEWLGQQGAETSTLSLPEAPYSGLRLMLSAEAAAVFDDLLRAGGLDALEGQRDGDWPNHFRSARMIPAVEMLRASRLRTQLMEDMASTMADVDVLISGTHDGALLTCTNLTGHPTAVLPVGVPEGTTGRPNLISLTGQLYGEADILRVAAAWQTATDWHRQRPALTS